jgi:oligosaccharide repeat unit polymerase
MVSIIFLLLAFIFYVTIFFQSKDLLHPLGIGVFLWFLAASLSNVELFFDPAIQIEISVSTNIAIFVGGFFFAIPFVYSRKIDKNVFSYQRYYFKRNYRYLFNFFAILSLVAFIIRFQDVLTSPPLFYGTTTDLKESVPDAVPFINFADLSITFLALLCVFEIKYSIKISTIRKANLLIYIVFCIFSTLIYKVSRGEFLTFALGFLYVILIQKKIKISLKHLVIICTLLFLFFYLGALRISTESRASNQFGEGSSNMILSQIYTYVAMNFQNLNALIISNFEPTYIWGSLKFILKPFFSNMYNNDATGLTDFYTLFFNAKTFIYYFYNDLGFIGVIIYPFIIGSLIQCLYNASTMNVKYFVLLACFMKPIIFLFFGNYFFGELVIMVSYVIVFIMLRLCVLTIRKSNV